MFIGGSMAKWLAHLDVNHCCPIGVRSTTGPANSFIIDLVKIIQSILVTTTLEYYIEMYVCMYFIKIS